MRRLAVCFLLGMVVAGCSKEEPVEVEKAPISAPVKDAIYQICRLERVSVSNDSARVLDVRGMSAKQFQSELKSFAGEDVHVWMPGEKDWLLVGVRGTNGVSLAQAMDDFADDTNCLMSVSEVFASYAGTRADILPAFENRLKGEVVPEWFVTKEVPKLDWLDTSGIDSDILRLTLADIRSMQVVRRLILEGNMLAAQAKDKKGEEEAIDRWSRAALRNPNDPLLLERIENLNRNAKGFLAVGKVLQAMKCYETIVLIRPSDATAVHNFGACLMKIGKRDMAEEVLKRAKQLREM